MLPETVANQIAAGEVVERPASVVKELVENALDAGATRIEVAVEGGGAKAVVVDDNGCGMGREDALACLERQATSKIATSADIEHIATFGFRGEAIPSIASVARFALTTRPAGEDAATELTVVGGTLEHVGAAGRPVGTTVAVRDLFFNVPARRKFLRASATELARIRATLTAIALAHPEVAFRLKSDGRDLFRLPEGDTLEDRVRALLGDPTADALLPLDHTQGEVRVHGYVSRPDFVRGGTPEQYVFVNRRPATAPQIQYALREAWPVRERRPVAVLFIDLPPEEVDVNVHPAKTVVKFLNEKQVFDLVYHAASDALDRDGAPEPQHTPPKPTAQAPKPQEFYRSMTAQEWRAQNEAKRPEPPKRDAPFIAVTPASSELGGRVSVSDFVRRTPAPPAKKPEDGHILPKMVEAAFMPPRDEAAKPEAPAAPVFAVQTTLETAPAEPEQTAIEPEPVIPWRIAGEVLDTYIICEDAEKTVWLIDKHAAHERVNFDRFKANLEPIMSQELLTPVVAQFAAAEYTALVGQLALLREFGFACEEFGDGAILIRALPADIPAEDAAASLEDLAGRLVETHHADPESARDALLHTMACKAAIKGGWKSDQRELRVLVDKVQSGEVRFCPHGRPVAVKLTKYELEKMFKRA